MTSESHSCCCRCGRWIIPAVVGTLIILAELGLSRSFGLFDRDFWLDEVRTYVMVADPDLDHAWQALKAGVNTNPPTYYLALRWFSALFGGAGELPFRLFSFVSILLAFHGMYLLLRRAFTPLVALTALIVTWAHPLVLRYAFESRCYALGFACVVWFAYFLAIAPRSPHRGLVRAMIALTSILTCTVHYVGLMTLAPVLLCDLALNRESWRRRAGDFLCALAGPLTLLAFLPLYFSQRAALPGTVLSPLSVGQLLRFGSDFFPPTQLPVLLVAAWFSVLWAGSARRAPTPPADPAGLPVLAGLSGLLLIPVVLFGFSVLSENVMAVPRYALPTIGGITVLSAFLLSMTPRWLAAGLLAVYFALGAVALRVFDADAREQDRQTAALISAVRADAAQAPVMFEITRELMVVWRYAPDLAPRCFFLDVEKGQAGSVDDFRVFVRNEARNAERFYPSPATYSWEKARKLPEMWLVTGHRDWRDTKAIERDYPPFAVQPAASGLVKLTAGKKH